MWHLFWISGIAVTLVVIAACLTPAWRRRRQAAKLDRARHLFQLRREWIEARFFTLASESGKPRGLRWVDCDFESKATFAKDRTTGDLRAFVGVAIRFEAIVGGDMEDNPNVGNVRAATAVFQFDGDQWFTEGRAIFNLDPEQTIKRFESELEMVE